jgi:hypothetical protein
MSRIEGGIFVPFEMHDPLYDSNAYYDKDYDSSKTIDN